MSGTSVLPPRQYVQLHAAKQEHTQNTAMWFMCMYYCLCIMVWAWSRYIVAALSSNGITQRCACRCHWLLPTGTLPSAATAVLVMTISVSPLSLVTKLGSMRQLHHQRQRAINCFTNKHKFVNYTSIAITAATAAILQYMHHKSRKSPPEQ